LKFNFDSSELTKGELETREKLLGRAGLSSDIRLFTSFYFDPREQAKLKKEQQVMFE
jgi:serum/glucocorticoid-regulated kinase 2